MSRLNLNNVPDADPSQGSKYNTYMKIGDWYIERFPIAFESGDVPTNDTATVKILRGKKFSVCC